MGQYASSEMFILGRVPFSEDEEDYYVWRYAEELRLEKEALLARGHYFVMNLDASKRNHVKKCQPK